MIKLKFKVLLLHIIDLLFNYYNVIIKIIRQTFIKGSILNKFMKDITNNMESQTTQNQTSYIQEKNNISKSLPNYQNKSSIDVYRIGKSTHVVHDHLINTFDPKRTSINLNSFIQVFRKKVRQTSIAKEFQNSLEKFKSLNFDRNKSFRPVQGGFIGNKRKHNQLQIQNSKNDSKLKKIIISDSQFRERKLKRQRNYSKRQVFSRKLNESQHKQQIFQNQQINKASTYKSYWQQRYKYEMQNNTQHTLRLQTLTLQNQRSNPQSNYNTSKCQFNRKSNPQHIKNASKNQKLYTEGHNRSTLFTNRRLQTIVSYQRPNLIKKNAFNPIKQQKIRQSFSHLNSQNGQSPLIKK